MGAYFPSGGGGGTTSATGIVFPSVDATGFTANLPKNLVFTASPLPPGVYQMLLNVLVSGVTTPGIFTMRITASGMNPVDIDNWIPDSNPHAMHFSTVITLASSLQVVAYGICDAVIAGCVVKKVASTGWPATSLSYTRML